MKIFAVSDIHGHCTELKRALDEAGFDKNNQGHLLVCCGDYFDRGTENREVMKYLERISNKVMLLGNHEDMLREILLGARLKTHNYLNGTDLTVTEFFGKGCIDSFGTIDFSGKTRDLDRLEEFLGEMKSFYETENYIFTHGWLPTDIAGGLHVREGFRDLPESLWSKARWVKWTDMYGLCEIPDGKTLVCGHYPTFYANTVDPLRKSGDSGLFFGEGLIAIDAGTDTSGRFNVLVLENNIL